MPNVKQPNYSKVSSILHEYDCEFTSTITLRWFMWRILWLLSENLQKAMMESYRPVQSIKEAHFMKLKVPGFSERCYVVFQILSTCYCLFHFNRINIFNLSVWFLTLYINMLCMLHFNCKHRKLMSNKKSTLNENYKFFGQRIGCLNYD